MLLIDGVFVNNGGGLVLLKYLVDYLETELQDVFYLLDSRAEADFLNIPNVRKKFISNSLIERYFFYKNNKKKFNKVLCFGNVPPSLRLKAKVYVYFHQKLYLSLPEEYSIKNKIIFILKQNIIKFFKKNADQWLVQSNSIADELSYKYKLNKQKQTIVVPFYPPLDFLNFTNANATNTNGFLYVSNSSPHKNHYKLIESFCLAYDQLNQGNLTVTVPHADINLCDFINTKINLGYPIRNVGFIEREKLAELYLTHEYLIFPSLAESFGLGLAEAIDGGCKVIAADLNYTYEVCEPTLVFDPYSIDSIKNAIVTAVRNELPYPQKLIKNEISKIVQLLAD
ncbi:glycosyltransferase [Acinetobacter towneri]|uniref:glycosyltransferase n=1 Tax=Acinetobacter towneri TaxID=202956 RepID=UPI001F6129B2|nr:glycosyltransferase [Acinetobacter towneri]UNT61966.1 glycosyltransferase [Acinetobacter towneri]